MSEDKSLYDDLDVSPDASQEEIRKAYLAKAQAHHPDKNKDADPDTFKRVSGSYMILKDPEKRAKYDRGQLNDDEDEELSDVGQVAILIENTLLEVVAAMDANDPYNIQNGAEVVNLITSMVSLLKRKAKGCKKDIGKLKRQRDALRKIRSRTKRKAKSKSEISHNLFDAFFKEKIEHTKKDIEATKERRRILKLGIVYVRDFNYIFEEGFEATLEAELEKAVREGKYNDLLQEAEDEEASSDDIDDDEDEEPKSDYTPKPFPIWDGKLGFGYRKE